MKKKTVALLLLLVLALALPLTAGASKRGVDFDKDTLVTIMPHAHIDTAWNWPQSTTVTFAFTTFFNALNLIDANDNYCFNSSNSKHLMWLQEYYPAQFERVVQAVKDGKWDYDSGWTESDLLLMNSESLTRCYMYAQKWFLKEFGAYSRVTCLPDNFGMGWNLPQFMKKLGYDFFVSTRVSAIDGYEGTAGGRMGNDLFLWRGIDDTEILFFKPSPWYAANSPLDDTLDEAYSLSLMGLKKGMYLSGNGDAGGGMSQDMIDDAMEANETEGYPSVALGTMSEYYDSLTEEDLSHVTIRYDDELYFVTTHGCYTSQAATKWYNRKLELGFARTEEWSSLGDYLGVYSYPEQKLMDAWDKLLTTQAHGILTGEGITVVFDEAWNDYVIAESEYQTSEEGALRAIARQMDTSGEGYAYVVFNPVSQTRTDVVTLTVPVGEETKGVRVTDSEGKEMPSQMLTVENGEAEVLILASEIPSLGMKVFYATPVAEELTYDTGLSLTDTVLENDFLRVEINPLTGNVCSLVDKSNGMELIQAGEEVEMVLMEDNCRTVWNLDYVDLNMPPVGLVAHNPVITVVENGPVRVKLHVEWEEATTRADGVSTYKQDIILTANGERVDFHNIVDWKEHDIMLKVQIPMNLSTEYAAYDLSNGVIERPNESEQRWEVYSHMWIDMTDESGAYGLSVLNDCKYGSDKYTNNILRLTLLRSARDQDSLCDVGVHEFTYSLYPHEGDWRQGATSYEARDLNDPLEAVAVEKQGAGSLGTAFSLVEVDQPNIVVTAFKISEADLEEYDPDKNNEYILRLNELFGTESTEVKVTFPFQVKDAVECNLLEDVMEDASPVAIEGNTLTVTQTKWEYKTLSLHFEENTLETREGNGMVQVDLTKFFNLRGFSQDLEDPGAGLDYYGKSFPSEHAEESIYVGEIPFTLGNMKDAGVANAVDGRGQVIDIPAGSYKALHLAACAAGYDQRCEAVFTLLYADGTEKEVTLLLEDWLAQYGWRNGSYCAPIAYTFAHYHKEGSNVQETRASMFYYQLDCEEGELVGIRLPDNDAVKVFALTAENR